MMIYFFCFETKNNLLGFFSRVWTEIHFSLKSPFIYYFQIFIEIICRCLSVMYNRKQRSVLGEQLFCSESFCKIINVNLKQQRTKDETLILFHLEICPLRTTRYFLAFKQYYKRFSKFFDSLFSVSLKMIPSCHTFLNAFEISRKTLLTSSLISKDSCIS